MEARNAFSELGAWVARKRRERRLQKEKERTLSKATEVVVDAADPRIRQVRGYKEKLGPAVQKAMSFADELVEALPGPVEVGRDTWAADPYVRAFFASVDEMGEVLRLDRELEAFFKGQSLTECYALLTMRRREQTVFRTDQIGEIIRRDVAKTAVSFVDHRIMSPCGTEVETRAAFKAQTLAVLSDYASEKFVSLRSQRDELRKQKDVMKAKLKVLRDEFHDSHPLGNRTDEQEGSKISEAGALLTEIDSRIEQANLVLNDPGGCLAHVADVLSHPLDNMKPETMTLRLSPMGIKEGEGSPEANPEILLTEIELRNGVKRVPVVAKFKRTEVLGL
jgi:uncharacterized coiled-coil protein SlyX